MSNALISVGDSVSNSGLYTTGRRLSSCQCPDLSYITGMRFNSSIMGLLETNFYQTLAASFFGCILLFRQLKKSRSGNPKGLPLPPGPKGYPLIGSLFDMPLENPWLVYDEWSKTYGKSLLTNSIFSQRLSASFYR